MEKNSCRYFNNEGHDGFAEDASALFTNASADFTNDYDYDNGHAVINV